MVFDGEAEAPNLTFSVLSEKVNTDETCLCDHLYHIKLL